MRQLVIAILVVVFGPIATLLLERAMDTAPDWIWQWAYWGCVTAGVIIAVLSDPIHVRIHGKESTKMLSTAIVSLAAAVIVGAMWAFIVLPKWPLPNAISPPTDVGPRRPNVTITAYNQPMARRENLVLSNVRNNGTTASFSAQCEVVERIRPNSAIRDPLPAPFPFPWYRERTRSAEIRQGRVGELEIAAIEEINAANGRMALMGPAAVVGTTDFLPSPFFRDSWTTGPDGEKPGWVIAVHIYQDEPELPEPMTQRFRLTIQPGSEYNWLWSLLTSDFT